MFTPRSPLTRQQMSDQFIANWLARPKPRHALGYLLSVASVGLAFLAARIFLHYHLPLAIMSFSFCAIAISFWYAGIGPGVLALVLAVLIRTLLFQPEVDWISRITYDFVFMLFSSFMLQATRAKNELESSVAKRTAALTKANEELHQEISDRKRAEEALQENVAALKNAFEEIQILKDQLYKENLALREEIDVNRMFEEIVGASPALQVVLTRVAKVAPTDSTVLITGETGTGKELIARALHKRSARAARAFVTVNCAAVPPALIASELFGHEKGAFTGALQRRLGRFELAEGGTLFLDEVGDLPLETQIALLRVLQEREFERVGGTEMLRCDVRVVAATNRDLHSAIAAGSVRSDLFYRLNVFPIELPPLRERKEDIPILVNYFVNRYAQRAGKKIDTIRKKSIDALQEYSWPGNVRELQNVIERSLIIVDTNEFSVDKNWLSHEFQSSPRVGSASRISTEQEQIEAALAQTKGKDSGRQGAAAILGLPASTLESKIRTLRINKHAYKGA